MEVPQVPLFWSALFCSGSTNKSVHPAHPGGLYPAKHWEWDGHTQHLNNPHYFHANLVFKSHIPGESPLEQPFKQHVVYLHAAPKIAHAPCQAMPCHAQGSCFAAPPWPGHSRSFPVEVPGCCCALDPHSSPSCPFAFPLLLWSCSITSAPCPVPSPGPAPALLPSFPSAALLCPNIYSMHTIFF